VPFQKKEISTMILPQCVQAKPSKTKRHFQPQKKKEIRDWDLNNYGAIDQYTMKEFSGS